MKINSNEEEKIPREKKEYKATPAYLLTYNNNSSFVKFHEVSNDNCHQIFEGLEDIMEMVLKKIEADYDIEDFKIHLNEIYYNLGIVYINKGRIDKSIQCLEVASEDNFRKTTCNSYIKKCLDILNKQYAA